MLVVSVVFCGVTSLAGEYAAPSTRMMLEMVASRWVDLAQTYSAEFHYRFARSASSNSMRTTWFKAEVLTGVHVRDRASNQQAAEVLLSRGESQRLLDVPSISAAH